MKSSHLFSGQLVRAVLLSVVVLTGFSCAQTSSETKPSSAVTSIGKSRLDPDKLKQMDVAILQAIDEKKCPGGVLWVQHGGEVYTKAYGKRSLQPSVEDATKDTIYDAASLTKVCATTPAIMILVEEGKVKLDAPVSTYIPEFTGGGKEAVKVKHLMTHTSGLRSGIGANDSWAGYDGAIKKISEETLRTEPGTMLVYSDINFITLGEIVRRVSGQPLNDFVQKRIYGPLKMVDSGYLPSKDKLNRVAPTEPDAQGKMLRGVVHDPTARKMGGVAGHAGLFTTAADLSRYARMLLNGGELDGVRIMKPQTVKLMTSVHTPEEVNGRRGLGWDIDSSYSGPRGEVFPRGSYGHTGWTGTSIWLDPYSQSFVMFLSNRNHPDGKGNVGSVRSTLGTLAGQAITGFDFANVPGALSPKAPRPERKIVLNGIDVLVREHFIRLRGLRVALITNHTGQDRDRNPTIDLLKNAPGVELKMLFAPEHGIRGLVDAHVSDSVDEKTGLPIYSLYSNPPKRQKGQSDADFEMAAIRARAPQPKQLAEVDAIIFDIQDISARFYTYSATLGAAIEAAGKAGKKIYVLDRVNPITGKFEGPVQTRNPSFIGFHNIPVRHGMTFGELANMFNEERRFKADVQVVKLENWSHDMWYDATGLPWSHPSPNIRSLNAATLYTGICLLESTKVSMGRGTDAPFETFGAPFIDDVRFAWEMNRANLPGVSFIPIRFTPAKGSKLAGVNCGGVHCVVTDREKLNAVDVGIVAAQVLYRLYPKEFDIDKMERLLGHNPTLKAIKEGKSLEEIKKIWAPALTDFAERRKKYLLYP